MTISFDIWDVVRVISLLVNCVTTFYWARNKLQFKYFLEGRWGGHLQSDSHPGDLVKCILIITTHKEKDISAVMVYDSKCSETSMPNYAGVDHMMASVHLPFWTLNRKWNAKFKRHAHHIFSNAENDKSVKKHPAIYTWSCAVTSIVFNPKMKVTIVGHGAEFEGVMSRV